MIPRIIHQTYPEAAPPAEVAANIDRLRSSNPGWQYRYYDDREIVGFIGNHYGAEMLEVYSRINPAYGAARADFFRYLLIYEVGGVYLDIKSTASIPFDQVLTSDDQYILSFWPNRSGEVFQDWGMHDDLHGFRRGEFQNWHVIAVPRHPFLLAVINNVRSRILAYKPELHGVGPLSVIRTTGPIAYTLSIGPMLHDFSHRLADTHDKLGLVYNASDADGVVSHRNLFKVHYYDLSEPLVL